MKNAEYDIWDYLSHGCGEVDLYLLYEEAALSPAPDLTPPPVFFFFFFDLTFAVISPAAFWLTEAPRTRSWAKRDRQAFV